MLVAPTRCWITLPAVLERTGVSKATIYRLIAAGGFPAPIKVRGRSVWSDFEVDGWMGERETARRARSA